MLGMYVSKFHEFVRLVENKDPHRLHARLEQTPSELQRQNYFGAEPIFLTMTLAGWRGASQCFEASGLR